MTLNVSNQFRRRFIEFCKSKEYKVHSAHYGDRLITWIYICKYEDFKEGCRTMRSFDLRMVKMRNEDFFTIDIEAYNLLMKFWKSDF